MKKYLFVFICISLLNSGLSQNPAKPSSSEIFAAIQKLQVLGSVLYVAAHPDDENTRMISYFANEKHLHTTYLSCTRGDGGQNLVGPEIQELLGIIRTQELLMARRTDGGNQMFTRANDFGYSKHPDETLVLWDKKEVLADVVWAIRKTRPDIIINRFDHRTPGRTHGHHTSSAILSNEAFDLAGSKEAYQDQLPLVKPWQPHRLFFNTSWWFYGSRANFEKADKSNLISVDVGVYYPLLGKSNNEIAALSRSMHKSQGFGATGTRGSEMEYLEWIKGNKPTSDPLEGINTTWARIQGGAQIGTLLNEIEQNFNLTNPSASVPDLVKAYKMIHSMPDDGFWVPKKLEELKQIIYWCAGLYVEAVADSYTGTPGQTMPVYFEAINRSDIPIMLERIGFSSNTKDSIMNSSLAFNQRMNFATSMTIPEDSKYSSPYWLEHEGTLGMYAVRDQKMRGLPESKRPIYLEYSIQVNDVSIPFVTPVVYKQNDPVGGEMYRPFEVSPPVFLNFTQDVFVFGSQEPKTVHVIIKANAPDVQGTLTIKVPDQWNATPAKIPVELALAEQEQMVQFTVFPPSDPSEEYITLSFTPDDHPNRNYSQAVTIIEYDHIPTQTVLKEARAKVVKVDLFTSGDRIGYIMGAGDKIPEYLEQVGYQVNLLNNGDITLENLNQYDAIITGIRAYNTNDRIKFYQDNLLEYVNQGGTLIVQYNTNRGLKTKQIAPFPLQISRDRVAVEEAEVNILVPDHPVMNVPNKITSKDFDGWVQERGLYFANDWDDAFVPILSSHDPGEPDRDGGLLITPYGKGHYIYTGYSWFRQLPAGVPGAFRIFTNLISLGNHKQP